MIGSFPAQIMPDHPVSLIRAKWPQGRRTPCLLLRLLDCISHLATDVSLFPFAAVAARAIMPECECDRHTARQNLALLWENVDVIWS